MSRTPEVAVRALLLAAALLVAGCSGDSAERSAPASTSGAASTEGPRATSRPAGFDEELHH
jgi:hypothetical protein